MSQVSKNQKIGPDLKSHIDSKWSGMAYVPLTKWLNRFSPLRIADLVFLRSGKVAFLGLNLDATQRIQLVQSRKFTSSFH